MLDIPENLKQLFIDNTISASVCIKFPDDNIDDITDDNIIMDSFDLESAIMESELKFGGCIASKFAVNIIDIAVENFAQKRIQVECEYSCVEELVPSDSLFPRNDLFPGIILHKVTIPMFNGVIDSAVRQKDNRRIREIIAYDDFKAGSEISAISYFKSFAYYTGNSTLGNIKETTVDRLFAENYDHTFAGACDNAPSLSLTESLVNECCGEKLTLLDLLTAYCEINFCCGVVSPTGQLKFVRLDNSITENVGEYFSLSFEDYVTAQLNLVEFPYNDKNSEALRFMDGSKKQGYISDNIITRCCSSSTTVRDILTREYNAGYINRIRYQYCPFTAELFSYFWLEPGDKVRIYTGYDEDDIQYIDSFILKKTIKGSALRLTIEASGPEYLGKDEMDSVQ